MAEWRKKPLVDPLVDPLEETESESTFVTTTRANPSKTAKTNGPEIERSAKAADAFEEVVGWPNREDLSQLVASALWPGRKELGPPTGYSSHREMARLGREDHPRTHILGGKEFQSALEKVLLEENKSIKICRLPSVHVHAIDRTDPLGEQQMAA